MGAHRVKEDWCGRHQSVTFQQLVVHWLKIVLHYASTGLPAAVDLQAGGHFEVPQDYLFYTGSFLPSPFGGFSEQGGCVSISPGSPVKSQNFRRIQHSILLPLIRINKPATYLDISSTY